jgi:serine/threonine-protein kinase
MQSMQPVLFEPGQLLAGTVYRVIRHLATGGMGSVYDVEDTTVEKRYVLKTLHPQLVAREDLARRMRDEAKSLARLNHPNIVDVITAGITTDALKIPFYVMERLVGQNLRSVLRKKGALEAVPALRIAIDVASALEHAHENSIVHRDVKPENIFLHASPNGATTTKLVDFGIVRLLDRKASHTHGKFIGTLRYASPEQIASREIGPPSDIYSLGLVLYEMLAGQGPFDDAGDAYAIGAAQVEKAPPPLSRFVPVAPGIERLVASAIEKDPSRRPRSCFAFRSELRRLLDEEERTPQSATQLDVLSRSDIGLATQRALETGGTTAYGMIPPSVIAPPEASVFPPTMRTPSSPGIDRNAPTRTSAYSGGTQRLATNDTQMEGVAPRPANFATPPQPVALPPHVRMATTGPLAGEASTRPPERGPFMLLGVAVVLAIALVAGAAVTVGHHPLTSVTAATAPTLSTPTFTPSEPSPPPVPVPTVASTSAPVQAAPGLPAATATATVTAPAASPTAPRPRASSRPAPVPTGHAPAVTFEP